MDIHAIDRHLLDLFLDMRMMRIDLPLPEFDFPVIHLLQSAINSS